MENTTEFGMRKEGGYLKSILTNELEPDVLIIQGKKLLGLTSSGHHISMPQEKETSLI